MFAGYLVLEFKDGREIHQINYTSQTLMNLQHHPLRNLSIATLRI